MIYAINEKNLKVILDFNRKIEDTSMFEIAVTQIKFNPIFRNILTISYRDGLVDFIDLSEDFYKNSFYDMEKFKENIIRISNNK